MSALHEPNSAKSGLIVLDAVVAAGLASLVAVGLVGSVRVISTTAAEARERAAAYALAEQLLLVDMNTDTYTTGLSHDGRFNWSVKGAPEPELRPVGDMQLERIEATVTSTTSDTEVHLATRRWIRHVEQ